MGWPIQASVHDWLTLLWLGVFQIGMAYALLTRGVRHVTALDASLLLLAEPVLNPVWAWMIHGERPTSWALAGGRGDSGGVGVADDDGAGLVCDCSRSAVVLGRVTHSCLNRSHSVTIVSAACR